MQLSVHLFRIPQIVEDLMKECVHTLRYVHAFAEGDSRFVSPQSHGRVLAPSFLQLFAVLQRHVDILWKFPVRRDSHYMPTTIRFLLERVTAV